MPIKSVAAALLLAPCLVRAASPALDLRLIDVETSDVIELAADIRGVNVLAVRPATEPRFDIARQRMTLMDLRQKALDLANQKIVQRNGIEVVLPTCQRPRFSAVTLPTNERVTIRFSRVAPSWIFHEIAKISGLELGEKEPFPDADVMLWILNTPLPDLATAVSAAFDVELRVVGKTLQVHRRANDAACAASQYSWVSRPEDLRRAKAITLAEKYSYAECGRKKKLPETHGTPCQFYESYPLGEFGYHGFVKLSDRSQTGLLVKPPAMTVTLAFPGDRFSEDFVAVTDVDTEAAHLIRWSYRDGQVVASEFLRVPMSTGKSVAETPDLVPTRLPYMRDYAERYALEDLRVEDIGPRNGKLLATARDVHGRRHFFHVGSYLGRQNGRIFAIDPAGVSLKEIVPDNLGGFRESEVRLQKGVWYEHPRDILRRKLALPVNDSQPQRDFIAAARDGDTALMQALAAKGANLDAALKTGDSNALFAALDAGSLGAARWLLARQARPNLFVGPREMTPLHLAVGADDLRAARALLDAGADVNLANGREQTPLRYAVSDGSVEMVKFLLSRGAKPQLHDEIGITPFTLAAHHGRIELIAEFIAAGVRLEDRDRSGYTMLSAAVQGSQLETVRHLIRRGANVNAPDDRKRSPLDHALEPPASPEMVELLEASGARRGQPPAE
jgi:ankyrin repeat protein